MTETSASDIGRTIVVGIDGSQVSGQVLDWACGDAVAAIDRLHIVFAWHAPISPGGTPLADGNWIALARQEVGHVGQAKLDEILRQHSEQLSQFQFTSEVREGPASQVLVEVAAQKEADLLVVGSRGHSNLVGMLIGSVSEYCVAHAPCPVVVVRNEQQTAGTQGPPTIVVGIDGSTFGDQALRWAAASARRNHAELSVVLAWHVPFGPIETIAGVAGAVTSGSYDFEANARIALVESIERCQDDLAGVTVESKVIQSAAAKALLKDAGQHNTALLVVGSRGLGGFFGLLLGSTSRAVAAHAPCPVVVVRG